MGPVPVYRSKLAQQAGKRVQAQKDTSLFGRISNHFNKPLPNFRDLPRSAARLNRKTNAAGIAPQVISAFSSMAQAVSIIFSAIFKGSAATETQSPVRNKAAEIAGVSIAWGKVGAFVMVAWGVVEIFRQFSRLATDPFDASMQIGKKLSDMGFSASTALSGLQQVGVISSVALKIIPVLNIVAAALSASEFFRNVHLAYFHKKNVVNLTWNDELKDMKRLFREVRKNHDNHFFEKAYGIDSRIMRKHLRKLNKKAKSYLKKDDVQERMKGRDMIDQVLVNLRSRAKMNVHQSQMAMIAALVGSVALLIIAFSPLGPFAVLGFAMLAVSAVLYTANMIDERVSHHRFTEAMLLPVD